MIIEEILALARECKLDKPVPFDDTSKFAGKLLEFAKLVAAAEREACAEIAEQMPRVWDERAPDPQHRIAAAIRNRSNK